MLRELSILILSGIISSATLYGVDYDGEKSTLIEAPYSMCVIPPQINEAKAQGINVVNTKKAKALYDQNAIFFDAREKRHYSKEHVKGAYPVYFDESKAQYIALQLPADKKQPLVFYCYGESCANSYEAALSVRKLGYQNVNWLLNGYTKWKMAGYPISTERKNSK
ncbi:MAG: rhodanese-like domain-containing protein [Sulfuricurvum sp.]|uniref:rhodanese-like domain-containing protein n=1 Tax=Sulfuricurvum sp. TaxID=2025608 RepID=UPI0026122685|nr:rhodanese-like domain-containing protein [Sulfuricurvum sp.]MDD2830333.1 rhodanese-like domain-containing protein [Sulfuricurvum sp.]MDD4950796.1 rhodanese-like domain-containing protein [Sulfuricurvum sp.]